jgi:hypothetical protein
MSNTITSSAHHITKVFDQDGNNVEALYRDVGNIGHDGSPTPR